MEVYADNAATTRMPQQVLGALQRASYYVYGNPSSRHSVGEEAKEWLNEARKVIGGCINCKPENILFTSGGSEADNQAIYSSAIAGKRVDRTHIVTSAFEHHAVLEPILFLKDHGFSVTIVYPNSEGYIDPKEVANAIIPGSTCLVSIMAANNEIGTIQDITEIGRICKDSNICFHTDAVQAVGHSFIDMEDQSIDFLSASAHKFGGPKGVGFLAMGSKQKVIPLIRGGHQQYGLRAGTEPVPLIYAMAKALELACDNGAEECQLLASKRDYLIDRLSKIPGSYLNGGKEKRLPGNVSFCFDRVHGETLVTLLNSEGIYASSGSACTSGSLEPSHVMKAIGKSDELANSAVRFSLSLENTDEEIEYIADKMEELVPKVRALWFDYD